MQAKDLVAPKDKDKDKDKDKLGRIIWLRLLWSQRRFLLRTGLAGLILSLVVSLSLPVSYESKIRLMPPEQANSRFALLGATLVGRGNTSSDRPSSTDESDPKGEDNADSDQSLSRPEENSNRVEPNFPGPDPSLLGVNVFGPLIVDALRGPTVEDQVIQKFDLRHRYRVRYSEDARTLLAMRTTIMENRKSGVISITVSDHDPYYAQQMAIAYVQALNALLAQVSTSSARRERIFLEQRLKEIKATLDATSQQFARFADQTGAFYVPSQTKAMIDAEARLGAQLAAAESELERLEQIYTDRNIGVRRLRASVSSLRAEVENFTGNQSDLASPQSEIAGSFPSLRTLSLVNGNWANLYRAFNLQEALYKRLTEEYELAKIQETQEIAAVDVLDRAVLPERKSFPPRGIMTVLGVFLSFVLAGAVVISAAMWKRRESPEKGLAAEIWGQLSSELTLWRARLRQVYESFGGGIGAHGGRD